MIAGWFKKKNRHLNEVALSDLLNFAHGLEEEGVILLKDGGFLVSYDYQAPDLDSATPIERDALMALFNRMLLVLEDGWMLHVDEIRLPARAYPEKGHFPDPVSTLIDEERRALYVKEGQHFENRYVLTFVWKFPLDIATKTRYLFLKGVEKAFETDLNHLLRDFLETVERAVLILQSQFTLTKLTLDALLAYLTFCIEGTVSPAPLSPSGLYLDVALAKKPLIGGFVPRIGEKTIYVLTVLGFAHEATFPCLLRELGSYPLVYRASHRFIPLSFNTAKAEIKRIERNWHNSAKGLMGLIKEMVSGGQVRGNQYALNKWNEASQAGALCESEQTRFGYWTSTLVLMHEEQDVLDAASKTIGNYLEQAGCRTLLETVNALEAWRGAIPGHGSCNARRLLVTGYNFAHALPLSHIWCGEKATPKSSLLPPSSPPVFYGVTLGQTPFRYHLDSQDVGHQVLLGPTGSGKSTFLGLLVCQFLRYQKAQIFIFDKDFSHQALTKALGGRHDAIGQDPLSFCPLQKLDTFSQKMRAQQFIENLVLLQNVTLTPLIKSAIHQALAALSVDPQSRSLSVLVNLVQCEAVRQALNYYTEQGQVCLLDAESDTLQTGYLQTFEMGWLLSQKPEVYLPVLLYLFDQIETRLEESIAKCPALIILEEAWLYLTHPIFVNKIRDWLKTLRKKNARVIFATQSLSDLYDPATKTLTQVTATLFESCPTKVFLPNLKMESEARSLYQKMGLNVRQLDLIGRVATPKHHYYVTTPQGNRLIHLGLAHSPLAKCFIGLSKEKSQQLLDCQREQGEKWLGVWLAANHLDHPSDLLNESLKTR